VENGLLICLFILLCFLVGIIAFILGVIYRKKIGEKKIGSAEELADKIVKDANDKLEEAKLSFNLAEKKVAEANEKLESANNKAFSIIGNAETDKKEILLDAKEEAIKIKNKAEEEVISLKNRLEDEINQQKFNIQQRESYLLQKEQLLEAKSKELDQKECEINKKLEDIALKDMDLDKIIEQQNLTLQEISNLTKEQAKQIILDNIRSETSIDASKIIKEIEAKTKIEAEKKINNILMNAMQRCNIDHVAESIVSIVELPNEDLKGKIIGREGRNIRLFESITGVDLIIDDTPGAIVLSAFDPVRREIARMSLEKLVTDGRIHPARIEEVVNNSKQEIEKLILEEGESAIYETGVQGLHVELIKLLGKMKFRNSYGQNVLKHSIEVCNLCGLIAGELNLEIAVAKRAGLLHDIGKAVGHEIEGSHASVGAMLAKKYDESDIIVNAIESHHGDVEQKNIIASIVQIADAVSAARPGARRETLESYVKRLENLEKISDSFVGVEKSFAVHAGRELRIIVIPDIIDDAALPLLARDIAKKIEEELEYPGQIKVNIIRETRSIE